jgi:hypothetical protein
LGAEALRFGPGHVVIVQDLPERGAAVFREEVPAGRTAVFAYLLAGESILFDEIRRPAALGTNGIGGEARHDDEKMEESKSRRAYFLCSDIDPLFAAMAEKERRHASFHGPDSSRKESGFRGCLCMMTLSYYHVFPLMFSPRAGGFALTRRPDFF